MIRAILLRLLRKTRPPYECYWRDRALTAEKKLRHLRWGETIDALRSCRDHWKTSFEHERANVIRLRGLIYEGHKRLSPRCDCADCGLVRTKTRLPWSGF